MSLGTAMKKVGLAILHGIEYPFVHAAALEEILTLGINEARVAVQDAPEIKTLIVGMVQQFEALGPEVLTAIADKGLDFTADAATVSGIKAAFAYFSKTFLPGVEKIYAGLVKEFDTTEPQPVNAAPQPDPAPNPATPVPAQPGAQATGGVTLTHG